jgi:AraC-like DNA-binding protein
MAAPTTLPSHTDPLGEILHVLRLSGTLYCRSEFTAPWGIDLPPLEECMMFHVVTSGQCWLELEGEEPVLLQHGSLALVPHGKGHIMRSDPEAPADPLFDLPVEKLSERYEVLHHGGGGEYSQTICVVVRFQQAASDRLMKLLPSVLLLEAKDDEEGTWLRSTLNFISREAQQLKPGGETVITRLADVLVIQMIRSWIDSEPSADRGWFAAIRDKQIGCALTSIHRDPAKQWTVESLAKEASMSRSAFSARFTELVGESAMRYLTWWRMQLAHMQLRESSEPLFTLASRLGYQSEAAFCRAFKRVFGVPTGSVRRAANPSD